MSTNSREKRILWINEGKNPKILVHELLGDLVSQNKNLYVREMEKTFNLKDSIGI